MTKPQRVLADAKESLVCATKIVARLGEGCALTPAVDISSLRTAANQARQAAQQLDQLVGMLDVALGD